MFKTLIKKYYSISMIPKQYCAVHSIKGNTKKPRHL